MFWPKEGAICVDFPITEANLNYVGSLTLDEDLMIAADMIEYEKILIVNVNNGERIETYLIKGEKGSGVCCLNGPAARKGAEGDVVIILSYAIMGQMLEEKFKPKIVFPLEGNRLDPIMVKKRPNDKFNFYSRDVDYKYFL